MWQTLFVIPRQIAGIDVFGFGWLLYLRRELLSTFGRHAWRQVLLALMLAPINLAAAGRGLLSPTGPDAMTLGVTAVTGALMIWLLTFGLTGLFQRYLNRPNRVVRYIKLLDLPEPIKAFLREHPEPKYLRYFSERRLRELVSLGSARAAWRRFREMVREADCTAGIWK